MEQQNAEQRTKMTNYPRDEVLNMDLVYESKPTIENKNTNQCGKGPLKKWYENKKNEERKTAADEKAERRRIGEETCPQFETMDRCFGQVTIKKLLEMYISYSGNENIKATNSQEDGADEIVWVQVHQDGITVFSSNV